MKVLFLTTAHKYNDDRIFYHQATEVLTRGFHVKICSLCSEFVGIIRNIDIESYSILHKSTKLKTETFLKICKEYRPDTIICSEPLAVFAAHRHSRQNKVNVIYDVTEWYPSLSMLRPYRTLMKWIYGIKFSLIQLFAGFLSDSFIFGEKTKRFPLAYIFPWKKQLILPYYPAEHFVSENIKSLEPGRLTLCMTGELSKDKGVGNFFNAVNLLKQRNSELHIKILIVGAPRNNEDERYFENCLQKSLADDIELRKPISFESFTMSFAEADICFDLREFNFENQHSLPIKLFYYMGVGKPVIYSSLKGIRNHIREVDFGFLVNPRNTEYIVNCIESYLSDANLYEQHASIGRKRFLEEYNWRKIADSFIDFIKETTTKTNP